MVDLRKKAGPLIQAPAIELDALAHGRHGDPFRLLGRHLDAGETVVRGFFPGADSVSLISESSGTLDMQVIHETGIFEVVSKTVSDNYQFSVSRGGQDTIIHDPYSFDTWLGEMDHYLFCSGTHQKLYERLGSHVTQIGGIAGVIFVVWAPNATVCGVIGEFNEWDTRTHVMRKHESSGLWEIFIPGLAAGLKYKYSIRDADGTHLPYKTDPFGHAFEGPPGNASIVHDSQYEWSDSEWVAAQRDELDLDKPVSLYEVHLQSWRRDLEGNSYSYRELAEHLIPYAVDNGFTHLELLPITEHPFAGSWGYQPIGMFAPLAALGSPDDFRFFVDRCHRAGLGVIMDWVPAHFPSDSHGLARFDGSALYEHEDPRQGFHNEWNTCIFNYGRNEVKNYLLANALYWVQEFHLDGLRVDAVASMLYLDYSREEGEWIPNKYGGRENLEAVEFLQQVNNWVRGAGAVTFAEESTSWDGVTRGVDKGGLGFTYKWNMGWMNDVLDYFSEDPINRKYHHEKLTFGLMYAFSENFILPFSHDETVYGKRSLLLKMPGDAWQQYANLRSLLMYLYTQPGKKLLFMGGEFAQHREWNHDGELDWSSLSDSSHQGVLKLVHDLNGTYRRENALHAGDCHSHGFQWIDCDDVENSVVSYYRRVPETDDHVICLFNFTPIVRRNYRVGVYDSGSYREILNSDAHEFGGSGIAGSSAYVVEEIPASGKPLSFTIDLPPLAGVILKPE